MEPKLSELFKQAREKLKLTQAELGKRLDLKQNMVAKYESGEYDQGRRANSLRAQLYDMIHENTVIASEDVDLVKRIERLEDDVELLKSALIRLKIAP